MHSLHVYTRQAQPVVLRHGQATSPAGHKPCVLLHHRGFSRRKPACCWLTANGAKFPLKTLPLAICWCFSREIAFLLMAWWFQAAAAWMSQP